MSDEVPTHRVVRKAHHRSAGHPSVDADALPPGQTRERFEVGDTLTPTEDELRVMPHRFEALGEAERDVMAAEAVQTATDDESPTPDPNAKSDDESASDADVAEAVAEADAPPTDREGVPETLTAAWVAEADYTALRSAARRYDDVNGNWSEDRLRDELAERAEG